MKLQLNSCDAVRPDARAIAKVLVDIADNVDGNLARELTDILLAGDSIEIIVSGKAKSSAYRSLRKLDIDYELIG